MERQHTEFIMQALETAYPQFYKGKTAEERKNALRLWHELFADDDGVTVGAAVKAFIATDTKGFPPSIGQIKQRIVQLKEPDMLDEAQAWALVAKAITRSGYHATEEFEKLPPVVRAVVGNPAMLKAWAMEPSDTLHTVIASNFQRTYRGRAEEAKTRLALPSDIRRLLDRTDCTVALPEPPDYEAQKRHAIALLEQRRDEEWRATLGSAYVDASRNATRFYENAPTINF